MPGLDKTGPMGEGPMTGRGLGICGGFYNRRFGFGRRFGFQRFLSLSKDDKKKLLKEEIKFLEEELKAIKDEMAKLE